MTDTMSTAVAVPTSVEVEPKVHTPQGKMWADTYRLAKAIAKTEFVPKGLRGNAPAVMAAVLFGQEHGLGPMQALQHIHVIDGKTSASAELMRAMIARAGHKVRFTEYGSDKCVIVGTRADDGSEMRVEWTMADAARAKLTGKDPWQKYPRVMLAARCTSELARMHFPDVILGLDYVAEEIDGDIVLVDDDEPLIDPVSGREARPDVIAEGEVVQPSPAARVSLADDEAGHYNGLGGDDEIPEAEIVPEASAPVQRPTEEVVRETFGADVAEVDAPGAETAVEAIARLKLKPTRFLVIARQIAESRGLPLPGDKTQVTGQLLALTIEELTK